MTSETWKKIDECLAEALELPTTLREEFLRSRLSDDPEAAAGARKLLASADDAERMFAQSPVAGFSGLKAGSRIGPWELVKPLGTGGMGVVWMARRADGQATMLAAIKLLPPALRGQMRDHADLEQRFLVEKQILARLQHPNIARLLDAGAGGGETPNFVMEYVDGNPLLDYLESSGLGRNDKLRLFLKICDAVQYAHGNLIIHRDLKPHNILVQPNGEPKLLDFGIGKVLNDSAGGGAITMHRAFSLDYASPEQVRGTGVSIATDIYSLGLILFEMMSGERARRWSALALGEVLDLSNRFTLPVHASVSVDLMAAMRKSTESEPTERYRTVSEFAADVERVLDGRPVQARPAGVLYQAVCFARRNRLSVTATVLALLAICGLAFWGWLAAQQAQYERALAVRQSQLLQAALVREQAALNSEIAARQLAVAQSIQAQNQAELARRFGTLARSRELQAEERLRLMLRILRGSFYSSRRDVAKLPGGTSTSIQLIERTLEQLREVHPSAVRRPDYLAIKAEAHGWLGELYGGSNSNLGKNDPARENREKSLELWREVNVLAPKQIQWECSYLEARFYLALPKLPRFDGADPAPDWLDFEKEYSSLANRAARTESVQRAIGGYYFQRALKGTKRGDPSILRDYEKSLRYYSKTLDETKPVALALRDVAIVHKYLAGAAPDSGAQRLYHAGEALRLDRIRAALDPSDATTQIDVGFSMGSVADARHALKEYAAAQKGYLEAFQLRKSLAIADPENVFVQRSLAYPIRLYGVNSLYLKDWAGLATAVQEFEWVARQPRAAFDPLDAISILYWKGVLAAQAGDRAGSCGCYVEASQVLQAQGAKEWSFRGDLERLVATCR